MHHVAILLVVVGCDVGARTSVPSQRTSTETAPPVVQARPLPPAPRSRGALAEAYATELATLGNRYATELTARYPALIAADGDILALAPCTHPDHAARDRVDDAIW